MNICEGNQRRRNKYKRQKIQHKTKPSYVIHEPPSAHSFQQTIPNALSIREKMVGKANRVFPLLHQTEMMCRLLLEPSKGVRGTPSYVRYNQGMFLLSCENCHVLSVECACAGKDKHWNNYCRALTWAFFDFEVERTSGRLKELELGKGSRLTHRNTDTVLIN